MTTSARNRILEHLCTTIRGMTTAGGYTFDVKPTSVTRDPMNVLLPDLPDVALPVYLVEPNQGEQKEWYRAGRVRLVFPFSITFRANATGLAPNRKMTLFESMTADLERVLTRDITRGGETIDTKLGECVPFLSLSNDPIVVGVLDGTCEFIRTYGEP